MIVIPADKKTPQTTIPLSRRVELSELQAGVGGFIETVPNLTTYRHEGKRVACFAFCNEEGKLNSLPLNERATAIWQSQFRTSDVLVGPVVIVFGDQEFMDNV
jgi:hypothetical protein